MSYLTTIVHPLIIIRMLQHRLFGPFTRRNNFNPTRAATAASTTTCGTNSLSIFNGKTSLQTPTANSQGVTAKSPSSNSILIASSTSFPSNPHLNPTDHNLNSVSANTSKSSSPQPPLNRVIDEEAFLLNDSSRKLSQISNNNSIAVNSVDVSPTGIFIDINDTNKLAVSPSHNSSSSQFSPGAGSTSKRSKLRDFSKKILRRVNSGNPNLKKNQSKKLRKQSKMNPNQSENSNNFDQSKLSFSLAIRGVNFCFFLRINRKSL